MPNIVQFSAGRTENVLRHSVPEASILCDYRSHSECHNGIVVLIFTCYFCNIAQINADVILHLCGLLSRNIAIVTRIIKKK